MPRSAVLLDGFRTRYKGGNSGPRVGYHALLAKLGNPECRLPPVFHVAGTNGKGSTCAFLRAMLEAAGYRVHVYTSPHLISFHERIRIAGNLIAEEELAQILEECERLAVPGSVSYFEAATVAAFVAFTRHAADFTILETGLGGKRDATNIVEKPLATLITRLSYDHCEYLGNGIDEIAREKAGIMRAQVPCFAAPQPDALATQTLRMASAEIGAPLSIGGAEWTIEERPRGLRFCDKTRSYHLPFPGLLGRHQYQNAGLAIAALAALPKPLPERTIAQGLTQVEWPGRLQRLDKGPLAALVPPGTELWVDGGHNDSAGEALAAQIARWRREDGANPKSLHIVLGMLTTKHPAEFLAPFAKDITQLRAVAINGEPLSFTADALSGEVRKLGIPARAAGNIPAALCDLSKTDRPSRILICGSLYLAGMVLGYQEIRGRAP